MTSSFTVKTTAHFDRAFRKLAAQHSLLAMHFARVIAILESDPYNRTRAHPIRKLEGVAAEDGSYRIRVGRFRFRYDIQGQFVYLKYCGLRREDTYR